jgi:hypothetical protein
MNSQDTARPSIDNAQKKALALGVIALILAVIVGLMQSHKPDAAGWTYFFQSYIFAFSFWIAIPLGSLAFLMLHHLTGGWWGYLIRRILEASSRTIWFMALMFVPVLVGMSRLYPWMIPGELSDTPVDHFKFIYLRPGPFTVRAIIYFVIWIGIAYFLNKWSAEQDRTGDVVFKNRMESLSAPGIILWALAITGAGVDWVMSLEPHWFSTIYGMLFMVIDVLAALTFSVIVLRKLSEFDPLRGRVDAQRSNDLGNLMLTFTMLWTYLSFSQFLIIWSGNLKDEIPWYMIRAFGRWAGVAVILILFHFFTPFFMLLQRNIKKRLRTLSMVARILLLLTVVDIYWLVVPSYEQKAPQFRILDLLLILGIGGLWLGVFFGQLRKLPLLPQHDPRFQRAMEPQHGD